MNAGVLTLLVVAVVYSRGDEIIGGYECPPHSQPWQAHLQIGRVYCGGVLINKMWVLTAAHCMKSQSAVINLGEHNLFVIEGTEQRIMAEKLIPHQRYNAPAYDNDVMLIKLRNPAQINKYVQPIRLSQRCSSAGEQCLVSGWGRTEDGSSSVLQCLKLPVLSNETCKVAYGNIITKNMFCAGFMEGGKDSCQGDSGGPVVCQGRLKGVVSFGNGCAKKGFPGVYAEVCRYTHWIKYVMANN